MKVHVSTKIRRLRMKRPGTIFRSRLRGRALTVKLHRRDGAGEVFTTYLEVELSA